MKNVIMGVEASILTLKVDLTKHFGPSTTGRTFIIGTTSGAKPISGYPGYSASLTVFRKRKQKKQAEIQTFKDEDFEEEEEE